MKFVPPFFFQAEDGIRDRNVTGVQTCALPISAGPNHWWPTATDLSASPLRRAPSSVRRRRLPALMPRCGARGWPVVTASLRSEERRVGKERRCPGEREQCRTEEER